jgi:hypothetical protein
VLLPWSASGATPADVRDSRSGQQRRRLRDLDAVRLPDLGRRQRPQTNLIFERTRVRRGNEALLAADENAVRADYLVVPVQ